jgi:Alginate export
VTGLARHRVASRLAASLAALVAFAGPSSTRSAAAAGSSGVFDPDAPPETRYRIAPFLTFGADLELSYEYQKNLALDDRPDNDAALFTPELSLALSFDPDPRFQAFLSVAVSREFVWKIGADQSKPSEDVALTVQEAYFWIRSILGGLSLKFGRQRFEDERQWLYDEELDGVMVRYERASSSSRQSAPQWNSVARKPPPESARPIPCWTPSLPNGTGCPPGGAPFRTFGRGRWSNPNVMAPG